MFAVGGCSTAWIVRFKNAGVKYNGLEIGSDIEIEHRLAEKLTDGTNVNIPTNLFQLSTNQ